MCKTRGSGGRFYYNATCCNFYNFTLCILYMFVVMHKTWREGDFITMHQAPELAQVAKSVRGNYTIFLKRKSSVFLCKKKSFLKWISYCDGLWSIRFSPHIGFALPCLVILLDGFLWDHEDDNIKDLILLFKRIIVLDEFFWYQEDNNVKDLILFFKRNWT